MNSNTKNNLLTWSVVLLIIANIVAITLFLRGERQGAPPVHQNPAEFLVHELGLNDKQQGQLHDLATQHHRQSLIIRENIRYARDQFFGMIRQPQISQASKDSGALLIAKYLEQLELLTFEHFQKVRMICTSEQQAKFDKIIDRVIKMVAGPPGGPMPAKGSGPPGPNDIQPGGPPFAPGDPPPNDSPR